MKNHETFSARKVIVATGGLSYPSTGSTGDGYRMAQEVGHTLVDRVPSLVPLVCEEPIPDELVGFVLKNVALRIERPDGKKLFELQGEMTFTDNGIAGPIVLSASRVVSRPLHQGEPLTAKIDLKPALSNEVLDKRLIHDLDSNGNRILNDAMRMWLPAELIPLALKRLKIEQFKLKEVNPKTMESRLVPGLFFAGEVLDMDADTGGYNLQIAFSTAVAAGSML